MHRVEQAKLPDGLGKTLHQATTLWQSFGASQEAGGQDIQ